MKKFKKILLALIGIILLSISFYFFFNKEGENFPVINIEIIIIMFFNLLTIILILLFLDTDPHTAGTEINEYYSVLRQSVTLKKLNSSEGENGESHTLEAADVLELMFINMKEIKEYYVLSKNMAKNSFRLSVSMCILGFTLITSSIVSIFILDVSLGSAVIPAVGGTIEELIAGTFLLVYRQSLDQLNKYYEALHENERFLSVVNIADKITPDKKDDIYMEIIRSQLKQKDIFS